MWYLIACIAHNGFIIWDTTKILAITITVCARVVLCFAWCKNSFPLSREFPCALCSVDLYMGHDLTSLLLSWRPVSRHSWLTSIFGNVGLIHGPETVVKSKHLQVRQHMKCKQTLPTSVQACIVQHKLIFECNRSQLFYKTGILQWTKQQDWACPWEKWWSLALCCLR